MSPARLSLERPPLHNPPGQCDSFHEPVEPHPLVDGVDSLRLVVVDREGPDAVRDHTPGAKITGVVDGRGQDLGSHGYVSEMTVRFPRKEAEERCFQRAEAGRSALLAGLLHCATPRLDLPLKPPPAIAGILLGEGQ